MHIAITDLLVALKYASYLMKEVTLDPIATSMAAFHFTLAIAAGVWAFHMRRGGVTGPSSMR